jgi:hypothetical protein
MARKYQFKKYEKTHHQMSLQATKALPTANVLNRELRKDTRTKVVIIIIIITVQKIHSLDGAIKALLLKVQNDTLPDVAGRDCGSLRRRQMY